MKKPRLLRRRVREIEERLLGIESREATRGASERRARVFDRRVKAHTDTLRDLCARAGIEPHPDIYGDV
jgi:hypothetical protein